MARGMSTDDRPPATAETTRAALLAAIEAQIAGAPNATTLLRLAEAYAWTVEPAQTHGGGDSS